jgi:hypothetical protein
MADLDRLRREVQSRNADSMIGSEAFDLVHRLRLATLEILDVVEADHATAPDTYDLIADMLTAAWRGE